MAKKSYASSKNVDLRTYIDEEEDCDDNLGSLPLSTWSQDCGFKALGCASLHDSAVKKVLMGRKRQNKSQISTIIVLPLPNQTFINWGQTKGADLPREKSSFCLQVTFHNPQVKNSQPQKAKSLLFFSFFPFVFPF